MRRYFTNNAMNHTELRLRVFGTSRKPLVHDILNAIVRRKGNRIRQLDFGWLNNSQRGILNIESQEPQESLIRRIAAVEGVLKVFPA